MSKESARDIRKRMHDQKLRLLALQMEGEINTALPQRKYRLCASSPCLMEGGGFPDKALLMRRYPVPDVKSAILIADIIYSEYHALQASFPMIWLERFNCDTGTWDEWDDAQGYSFQEYLLDENFVPHICTNDETEWE